MKEIVRLLINGEVQPDVVPDLLRVEVREDVDAASTFRVRIAAVPESDGTWRYLDDERFEVWNRVGIEAGYDGDAPMLVDGYVTHRDVAFTGRVEDSYVEFSGLDVTALMDLEEKSVAWPNKTDAEIAQAIFSSYGLSYEVEDTEVRHDEAVSTIVQRDSDIRFLRLLAARNGFECYVRGAQGFFRSPNLAEPPQGPLAIEFGDETNLTELRVAVDGTPPVAAKAGRVDPFEKVEELPVVEGSIRRLLGATPLEQLQSGAGASARILKHGTASTAPELLRRLGGAQDNIDRFVTASGEIDSRVFGGVLRSRRLVTIKGVGARLSGTYYVQQVDHLFSPDGYTQRFEATRNALDLTGEESFEAASLPLAIVPSVGGSSLPSGNRVLPAQQTAASLPSR